MEQTLGVDVGRDTVTCEVPFGGIPVQAYTSLHTMTGSMGVTMAVIRRSAR